MTESIWINASKEMYRIWISKCPAPNQKLTNRREHDDQCQQKNQPNLDQQMSTIQSKISMPLEWTTTL